jgi:hypothetical protein
MQSLLSLMLMIVKTVLCWTKIMMMSSGTTQSLSRGKLSPCNQCSVVVSMESGCSIHKRHRIDGSVVETNEQLVVTNTIFIITDVVPSVQTQHHRTSVVSMNVPKHWSYTSQVSSNGTHGLSETTDGTMNTTG